MWHIFNWNLVPWLYCSVLEHFTSDASSSSCVTGASVWNGSFAEWNQWLRTSCVYAGCNVQKGHRKAFEDQHYCIFNEQRVALVRATYLILNAFQLLYHFEYTIVHGYILRFHSWRLPRGLKISQTDIISFIACGRLLQELLDLIASQSCRRLKSSHIVSTSFSKSEAPSFFKHDE